MDVLLPTAERLAAPGLPAADEVAFYAVSAAVWAPSVHNTQPWRFAVCGNEISLHADPARQLMVADPLGREMMISCGAALFNARLALRSLGYLPQARVVPDPGQPSLVAQVTWRERVASTEWEQRLFSQVSRRRTHRGGFDMLPLSADLLAALTAGAERYGAMLRVIADQGVRAALAAAVETAERAQRLDSQHVQELAQWVFPPGSARRDGVPSTCYPAHAQRTSPYFPGRDFAHGRGWGLPRLGPAAASRATGVVCLLTTTEDRPADWVNAGQALQRVLLTSAACGVAAAMHSQPLELPWLRDIIRMRFCDGAYPQLVLRLGTVIQTSTSVRRPLASVLFAGGSDHRTISHD
jgi:hypothetical protein